MKLFISGLLISSLAFAQFATGFRHIPGISGRYFTYYDTKTLDVVVPNDFSWKDSGKLEPIANQGSCGSCWSFALSYSLMDNLNLLGNPAGALLSPQYLVSCAKTMFGCQGGTFEAADYLQVGGRGIGGAPFLKDMPYIARNGSCPSNLTAEGSLVQWQYVGGASSRPSTLAIQKAMITYGVIPIVIAANSSLMNYKSGIFQGSYSSINHMIVAVGFHNEGAVADSNGEYPKGKGYWEVRNSWGTKWGMDGFGNIRYHANRIADEAAFMTVKEKPLPPVARDFAMESKNLTITVHLSAENKLKVEDAKSILQPFLNSLDKR